MRHINDQTLDQLLEDSLDEQHERELEAHIQQCHSCAARLREWEVLFPQIRGVAPAADEPGEEIAMPATRSSVVMLPDWTPPPESPRAVRARPSLLWLGVMVLALVAAWLALRGPSASDETSTLAINEHGLPSEDTLAGGLGSGLGDSAKPSAVPDPATVTEIQDSTPAPVTEPATGQPDLQDARSITAVPDTENRPAVVRQEEPVRFPIRTDNDPPETPALPKEFTRVTLGDAIARLGGPVRLIDGLSPEAVEIATGSVLPGADPRLVVVRIIYNGPGGRIILDQQRLNRAGSQEPDIAINTAPSGVSVAQWVDWKGYWISLASRTDQQSLLAIANRIHESP